MFSLEATEDPLKVFPAIYGSAKNNLDEYGLEASLLMVYFAITGLYCREIFPLPAQLKGLLRSCW